jgi:hypothetical protein
MEATILKGSVPLDRTARMRLRPMQIASVPVGGKGRRCNTIAGLKEIQHDPSAKPHVLATTKVAVVLPMGFDYQP